MFEITANAVRFACLAEGPEDGPLALLLHGFPDTAHSWQETLASLAREGYRAVAPFMRGYHPTAIPADGDYRTRALGEDVLGLIEILGRKTAVVIGHDWGAYASYAAASLRPEKISKLVTVAIPHPRTLSFGNATPRRIYRLRHFFANRLPGAARRLQKNGFAAVDEIYRRWSPTWKFPPAELAPVKTCFAAPGVVDAALGYYRALPIFGQPPYMVAATKVPTLTVYGLDDGVIDGSIFEQAKAYFDGPHRLVSIPDAGHFVHREQPALFTRALLEFLREG